MKYDASFLIYINSEGGLGDIIQSIREIVEEIKWQSNWVGSTSRNYIEIGKNQFYDAKLVDQEDGYLYYQFEIMVTPRTNPVSEDEMVAQAQFAKKLLDSLSTDGIVSRLNKSDVNEFIEQ